MTMMRLSFRLFVLFFLLHTACSITVDTIETCSADGEGNCKAEASENDDSPQECNDEHEKCAWWASQGECDANPGYMLRSCQKSCEVCFTGKPTDQLIKERKKKLEEEIEYDITETPAGVKQQVAKGYEGKKTQDIVDAANKYVEEVVLQDDAFLKVRKDCKNRHPQCAYWASIGECDVNPKYMTLQCAPSCQTCDKIDFDSRCPWDKDNATHVLEQAGDLDTLFERIVNDPFYQKYEPTVHSRPPDGPWVVTLDKFVSDEEADRLIYLGGEEGYEISRDVGAKKFDGTYEGVTSSGRTSTNAWCNDKCYNDTTTKAVIDKIENLTGVPETNSEFLQLLRYDNGQFYHTHNDYIPHQLNRECGVRILTVFLYLSDVEEGGGTNFPKLDITVQPKKGKALIWPSVLNEKPNMKDRRTDHQALPVIKGLKFAANAWLHQGDFKGPFERGCN